MLADSTIDLPEAILKQEKIETVPLYINIGEQSFLDKVEMTRVNFYENLSDFPSHPPTATPGIESFVNAY